MKRFLTAAALSLGVATTFAAPADAVTRTWYIYGNINLNSGTGEIINAQVRGSFDFDADGVVDVGGGFTLNLGTYSNVNVEVRGLDEQIDEPIVYNGLYNSIQGFDNTNPNITNFLRLARDLTDPDTVLDSDGQVATSFEQSTGTQTLFLAFEQDLFNGTGNDFIQLNNQFISNDSGDGIQIGECAEEFAGVGMDFCLGNDQQAGRGFRGQAPASPGSLTEFVQLNAGFITTVVPVPAAAPLLLTGLAGLGFIARRRKKKAAEAA